MNMKQLVAVLLCVLMLASFAACKTNDTQIPPAPQIPVELQDATGSVFLGEWSVKATATKFDHMIFNQEGSVEAGIGANSLGGVFTDDGTTLTITISGQVLSGTYKVEGNTITVTTANETLELTKIVAE